MNEERAGVKFLPLDDVIRDAVAKEVERELHRVIDDVYKLVQSEVEGQIAKHVGNGADRYRAELVKTARDVTLPVPFDLRSAHPLYQSSVEFLRKALES